MEPTKKRVREEGKSGGSWIKSSFEPQAHEPKRPRSSHPLPSSSRSSRLYGDTQIKSATVKPLFDSPRSLNLQPITPFRHVTRPQQTPGAGTSKPTPQPASLNQHLQKSIRSHSKPHFSAETKQTPLKPISSVLGFSTPAHHSGNLDVPSSSPARGPEQSPLMSRLSPLIPPSVKGVRERAPQLFPLVGSAGFSAMNQVRDSVAKTEDVSTGEKVSEVTKGLIMSPEKEGRGKRRGGMVRSGLAERANQIIMRSQTDFSLWSHDISKSFNPASSGLSIPRRRPPKPDMRVKVLELLTDMKEPTPPVVQLRRHWKTHPPPPHILARCQILSKIRSGKPPGNPVDDVLHNTSLDLDMSHSVQEDEQSQIDEVLVLFCVSTVSSAVSVTPAGRISSMAGLHEGKDISIWRPWFEVDVFGSGDEENSTNLNLDQSQRQILMCSRFLVPR
ncbi:hypothetical protein FRC02_006288 [Tulasnella sp. 418]|nr:hypothetical protein FRC02_006288 [Tulasnella sp. 418]